MSQDKQNSFRVPLRRDAPRERKYRLERHGQGAAGSTLFFKPGASVSIFRPSFDRGMSVIRPLPMMDYTDPSKFTAACIRNEDGDWELSDFVRKLPAVRYFGIDRQVSFLLYDPVSCEPTYDPRRQNPAAVFIDAIYTAVDPEGRNRGKGASSFEAPRSWDALVKGKTRPVPYWQFCLFMQCVAYLNDQEEYYREVPLGLGPKDNVQVLVLPAGRQGVGTLILDTLREQDFSDGVDESYPFKLSDVCGFKNGQFLYLWNKDKGSGPFDDGVSRGRQVEGFGYKFHWDSRFIVAKRLIKNVTPALTDQQISVVAPRIQWWDDILYFPSTDEVALLVAEAFASRPDLLKFAWQRHGEFFTPEVRRVLKNAKTMAMSDVPSMDENEQAEEVVSPPPRRSNAVPTESRFTSASKVRAKTDDVEELIDDEELLEEAEELAEEELAEEDVAAGGEEDAEEESVEEAAPVRVSSGGSREKVQVEEDAEGLDGEEGLLDDLVDELEEELLEGVAEEDTSAKTPAPRKPAVQDVPAGGKRPVGRPPKQKAPAVEEIDDEELESERQMLDALKGSVKQTRKAPPR